MEGVLSVDAARQAIAAEKAVRAESLKAVVDRNPNGRLARKASVLMLDQRIFDDWVEEKGGDEGATRLMCAQVSEGVTLRGLAAHYGFPRALLSEWIDRDPKRLERYYLAQRWLAEDYVGEVVPLADAATVEDLAVTKWQGQARMAVAGKYNRARFGEHTQVQTGGVPVINFVMEAGSVLTVAGVPDAPALEAALLEMQEAEVIQPVIEQQKPAPVRRDYV